MNRSNFRKNTCFYHRFSVIGIALCLFVGMAPTRADEPDKTHFIFMTTTDLAGVHRASNVNTAVFAKVSKDAVVKVRLHRKMADCPKGWYERAEGGFICGSHLEPSNATAERPGPKDAPNLRDGLMPFEVAVKKADVYKKRNSFLRGHADALLLKGSVIVVTETVERKGKPFLKTRQGWYIAAEDCAPLQRETDALAVDVSARGSRPGAVVVARDARVYESPSLSAKEIATPSRWSYLPGPNTGSLTVTEDFVKLPDGGYVPDAAVARFRPAPTPKNLAPDERWIGVDLEEQLLTAYEGETPVRIMPCSTGVKGNTQTGRYTISRKLKQQTMQLRMCRVRVEDVQWVMYYDEEDSIAIHSAYWHDDFGTPVSHGCVNLTPADAKWLFDWAAPKAASTDTITVPLPRGSGTKVIVF